MTATEEKLYLEVFNFLGAEVCIRKLIKIQHGWISILFDLDLTEMMIY